MFVRLQSPFSFIRIKIVIYTPLEKIDGFLQIPLKNITTNESTYLRDFQTDMYGGFSLRSKRLQVNRM